jgi:hypothetical protein
MSLKINAGSLLASRYLKVQEKGIVFCNTDLFGSKKFQFEQIDFIYFSPKSVLSFQVGREVFSIPIQSHKKEHNEAMNAFVEAVKRTRMSATTPAAIPAQTDPAARSTDPSATAPDPY